MKAYEPIPDNDDLGIYLSDGEDETRFDAEIKGTPGLHYEEDAIASSITSYPASYRYQNCRDSDDDDDNDDKDEDLKLDSDLDEIEESDQEVDDVCSNTSDDAWVLSDNDVSKNQVPQQEQTSLVDLLESRSNARDRSRYVSSVLNPVENLSQWKVVKAKAATPQLKLQKENVTSEQDGNSLKSTKNPFSELKMRDSNVSDHSGHHHAIAVDASLTNWLSSLETRPRINSCSRSN